MKLVDSHLHLDAPEFDTDREAVVERAIRAGVAAFVVPATDRRRWPRVRMTAERFTDTFPAYGLHPYFIDHHTTADLDALARWLEREPAVAVGECGLDYYLPGLDRKTQQHYFEAQLELARRHRLPVIIHARKAADEVSKAIRRSGCERGVIHSFSGSLQQARRLIDLGFMLGFGGPVTYDRAKRLHRLIPALPLGSILLETDAPDQAVAGHRGERNEPAWLPEVLQTIADLREEPIREVAAVTTANACKLFGLSPL
ncbi:MAG: TatD family hydrolase [Pseudomonadota bacterium]|nr:TatD family hydrolase [Pseudomonadota bacterium]